MNSLPKTVTRQRRSCDLNRGPSAPESSTLTTRLPSHLTVIAAARNLLELPAILSKLVLVETVAYEAVVVAAVSSAGVNGDTNQLILTTATVAVTRICQRVLI